MFVFSRIDLANLLISLVGLTCNFVGKDYLRPRQIDFRILNPLELLGLQCLSLLFSLEMITIQAIEEFCFFPLRHGLFCLLDILSSIEIPTIWAHSPKHAFIFRLLQALICQLFYESVLLFTCIQLSCFFLVLREDPLCFLFNFLHILLSDAFKPILSLFFVNHKIIYKAVLWSSWTANLYCVTYRGRVSFKRWNSLIRSYFTS